MNPFETINDLCPWCSASLSLDIDTTFSDQEYIEDCDVCCSPILIKVRVPEMGEPEVELHRDNE